MQCPSCYGQMVLVEVLDAKFDDDTPALMKVYECEECGIEDIFYDDVEDEEIEGV